MSVGHMMELLLTNARVVTMQPGAKGYQIRGNQCIAINAGMITCIAEQNAHTEPGAAEIINCHNRLVTPGLIDCHTHLVFAGNRANEFDRRLNGVPYTEISRQGGGILATVRATRQASESELVELALPRLDGLIRSGVTSVEIKSGYGLSVDDEIKMLRAAKVLASKRPINITTTLLAAHAVPPEYQGRADDYIALVCEELIPVVAKEKLATSVDVFCESIGFNLEQTEKVFQTAVRHGLKVKGHTEQLSNLGGTALTARYKGLSADHLEYLDKAGVAALARAGTVATLLPGAFYFLQETQRPPVPWLREQNIPMAIATDFNPGTSPFADMGLIMNMACTLFGLTPEEALRGVTVNAAKALGVDNSRGQLVRGFVADLCIWNVSHPAELSYQVGLPLLHQRIVNGEVCDD